MPRWRTIRPGCLAVAGRRLQLRGHDRQRHHHHLVASLKEPLGGRLALRVDPPEWAKIALAFTGVGLSIAPPFLPFDQHLAAGWALIAAAALTVIIVTGYWLRALPLFDELRREAFGKMTRP